MRNILLLFFVSFGLISFSQERQNREKILFQKESDVLDQATGWSYDDIMGEWLDYKNVISHDISYKREFKELQGEYMNSFFYQNFISMQTRILILNGSVYYVLITKKYAGSYDYPSIKEDWRTYVRVEAWAFTEKEWYKTKDINGILQLKISYSAALGRYEQYDDDKIIAQIQNDMTKNHGDIECIFPIFATNGKIRFYLPVCGAKPGTPTYKYYKPDFNFEKGYFETDSSNFNKILIY